MSLPIRSAHHGICGFLKEFADKYNGIDLRGSSQKLSESKEKNWKESPVHSLYIKALHKELNTNLEYNL